jgi:hypothetical protein
MDHKPGPARKGQQGQTLVVAALGLAVLVIFFLGLIRYMQMLSLAQFTQETAKFAAEVGARPSGDLLTSGQLTIDEAEARAVIRAELERALDQASGINATKAEVIGKAIIEILQPAGGNCQQFPGDDRCFSVPAVRVTLAIPFNFLGLNVTITRRGVATTAPLPGSGRESREPAHPTPIGIPSQVATALPTGTPTPTPLSERPTDTPTPTATATPAMEEPIITPTSTPLSERPTSTPTPELIPMPPTTDQTGRS